MLIMLLFSIIGPKPQFEEENMMILTMPYLNADIKQNQYFGTLCTEAESIHMSFLYALFMITC